LDSNIHKGDLDMRTSTKFTALVCGLATLMLAVPAEARVNQRQDRQQQRIAKGISNGKLTAQEAARLEQQQAQIDRYEARSRADGRGLNRAERARLENKQDRASKSIYRKKHNANRR
jgi:hypothetical protein